MAQRRPKPKFFVTHRVDRPRQTIGRREVGILRILPGKTIRDFSEFRTSFSCREMNFPITDESCEQNTHSYSMYRCAQCVSTSHCTVWSLSITRTRVAQVLRICMPTSSTLVPCRTWHWPQAHVLSLTSPISQSSSPTHPSLLSHDPSVHCDDSRRSCSSSDLPISHTLWAQRIELDRNLEVEHQDQTRDRIMGDDYQSPIIGDMDEFGKFGVKSLSYNQSLIHSDYDSAESVADSGLEDGQLRKMPASPLYIQEREGDFDSSRKPEFQGNWVQWSYRREKQVHNGLKLITQDERSWCQVHLKNTKFKGNLMQ